MAASNWAESISQIFEEEGAVHKNTLILSKVKPKRALRKDTSAGFEILNEGVIAKVPVKEEASLQDPAISKERRLNKKRKFELLKTLRVKPDVRDRNRELTLKKVATKGVVQLFNAVQTQQLSLKKQVQAEKIDSKREDILNNINKKNFLNVLMGSAKSVLIDNPVKKEKQEDDDDDSDSGPAKKSTKESTWNVLKDTFVNAPAKGSAWDEDDSDQEQDEENDWNLKE